MAITERITGSLRYLPHREIWNVHRLLISSLEHYWHGIYSADESRLRRRLLESEPVRLKIPVSQQKKLLNLNNTSPKRLVQKQNLTNENNVENHAGLQYDFM